MNKVLDYLLLKAHHRQQVIFLMIIVAIFYLFNFHVNAIWTPNESFYAEAVREMFESGNFLDIQYNYEPRYNKPPLTYWSIAISCAVFGINEFAIRLPIVLMAIGSVWFTYLLGKQLYGPKAGLYALVMMAATVQLLAVKQYASPETPLTFFFTLTMYWFIKGYQEKRFSPVLLSYFALGLTVLTKGYPYLIVVSGIIGLFVLLDCEFRWKTIWQKVKFLRLYIGLPVVALVGLSWVLYMYMDSGDAFWEVYRKETFERALTRKSTHGPRPFFYLEVILWSILPYSLAFYLTIVHWIRKRKNWKQIAFPLSWLVVMLVIFTIAKGKIPTYMIQAHPAMILLIIPALAPLVDSKNSWSTLLRLSLLIPALLLLLGGFYLIVALKLPLILYLLPIAGAVLYVKTYLIDAWQSIDSQVVLPFWSVFIAVMLFGFYLPKMEQHRPYPEIGRIVNEQLQVPTNIPLLTQGTLIHNLPYYTTRYSDRDYTPEMINAYDGPALALVREEDLGKLSGFESVWSGLIYNSASESQFFKFVQACVRADNGDFSKFARYHLVTRGID